MNTNENIETTRIIKKKIPSQNLDSRIIFLIIISKTVNYLQEMLSLLESDFLFLQL